MDYKELLKDQDFSSPQKIADWMHNAETAIKELMMDLESAEARAETLEKMVKEYQDVIIPGYREQAEKFVCCPICTATMDEMNKHEITPGIYRKFDGSMYRVANLLVNNETGNVAVAYHSVGGGKLVFYLTPCEIFAAKVDKQKYPDATQEYCFEKVEDDYTIPDVVDTSRIACGSFTPPQNDFIRSLSQTNLVPVVRCRNCKYAYINSFAKESGVALCMHWTNRSDGVQMVMQFDDFCSYGEKKDG